MAGRGRAMVMPAWMTRGSGSTTPPGSQQPGSGSTSQRYDDRQRNSGSYQASNSSSGNQRDSSAYSSKHRESASNYKDSRDYGSSSNFRESNPTASSSSSSSYRDTRDNRDMRDGRDSRDSRNARGGIGSAGGFRGQNGSYQYDSAPQAQQESSNAQAGPPRGFVAPDGWMEVQADDGKLYFYNQFTQATTYEKPRSLMSEVEKKLPTTSWKEYVRDGKSYFYNAISNESVWEEPLEFTRYKERLRALCSGDAPTKDMDSLAVFKAARKALDECTIGNRPETAGEAKKEVRTFSTKSASQLGFNLVSNILKSPPKELNSSTMSQDDKELEFKKMLSDRRVPPGATWQEAIQYGIANDSRFYLLRSDTEREGVLKGFTEWRQGQLSSELEKELERLVEEKQISSTSNRRDCLALLSGNPAFEAFQSAKKRDDTIEDFLEELYRREKSIRKKKKQHEENLFSVVIQNWLLSKRISSSSSWKDDLSKDIAEEASRLPEANGFDSFQLLTEKNQEDIFEDLLAEEIEKEKAARQKAIDLLKDRLKDLVQDFADWLDRKLRTSVDCGELATSFKAFWSSSPEQLQSLKSEKFFEDIKAELAKEEFRTTISDILGSKLQTEVSEGQEGVSTEDLEVLLLLEDEGSRVVEDVSKLVEQCRKLMKTEVKDHAIPLKFETDSSEENDEDGQPPVAQLSDLLARLHPDVRSELMSKYDAGVQQESFRRLMAEYNKRIKRRMLDFEEMLQDVICKPHHADMSWETALSKITKEPEFDALRKESLRRKVFEEFMRKFRENLSGSRSQEESRKRPLEDNEDPESNKRAKDTEEDSTAR